MEFNHFFECFKNAVEAIAVLGGVLWFLFRVLMQKTYQRLTAEVTVKPVGPEKERAYEVECRITNKAPVRIDLEQVCYKVTGTGVCIDPAAGALFPHNRKKPKIFHYFRKEPDRCYWSVDAQSTERFICRFFVASINGANGTDAAVEVMFNPKMTGDETYTVRQSFRISGAPETMPMP
jgi:hypothetical protein